MFDTYNIYINVGNNKSEIVSDIKDDSIDYTDKLLEYFEIHKDALEFKYSRIITPTFIGENCVYTINNSILQVNCSSSFIESEQSFIDIINELNALHSGKHLYIYQLVLQKDVFFNTLLSDVTDAFVIKYKAV